MKKIILVLTILLTSVHFVMAKWQNALVPSGRSEAIILVKNGKANYKIIGEKNSNAVRFLRENLEFLTGVKFAGDTSLAITLKKCASGLGTDGYAIEIKNGNIFLYGSSDNGIMNAVTAFLEEDLGWRYYQRKQKAVSPGGKISKAKIVPRRYIPPFYQRSVYSKWAFDPAWTIANKTSKRKGGFGKYFVHTFFRFIPPAEFAASKPEFFALSSKGKRVTHWREGQLCMTNPEVRRIMAQRVIKAIEANPGLKFIAVSQNDADGYCKCPACRALLRKEKNPSGPLLHFVNAVAAEVAKVYPRIIIVTEAYRYSLLPPKEVKPAANVVIRLCLNNRISSYPFFFVSETKDMNVLSEWSKKTDRLLIWDYMTNFRHYLTPRADLPVLEKNIRLYRDKKVSGVMMQTNYNNEIGTQAAMRAWLCAKLLWNPDLSIGKLAKDYINGFWGKDIAPFMLKYNALLIKEWQQFHAHNKPGRTFYFSKYFYSTASNILKKAMAAAQAKPELLKELEREELTLDYYWLAKGVTQDAAVPAYRAVLDQFTGKLKKHNITHLGEGAHNTAQKQIEQYRDGIRLVKYTKTVFAKHIVLPATWNVYIDKGLTVDDKSLVGRSMKQEADNRWSIQWRFGDFSKLVPGKYKVRIRARANKKATTGHGTIVGVYNVDKSSYALKRSIKAQELDGEKYKWVDCGILKITAETMYLYTATAKNGAFKAFYVDAVEFIPVKIAND
jgi:Domain of unknown function (DUF4838)/delta endotoxin